MFTFDDATIERLFGAEDAENENDNRFKEYFYYNRTYDNLVADLPIRLLVGHKGIGKSALLRRAYLDNVENADLAVWIRPNDLTSHISNSETSDFNQLIEKWKLGLLSAVFEKALARIGQDADNSNTKKNLAKSGVRSAIDIIVQLARTELPGVSDAVTKSAVSKFMTNRRIYVYIDDIDRGWDASSNSIKNISALLNGLRDLAGTDDRLMFRMGLRTDVYFLVRTSDESTDKIERNVLWLEWTNHEILHVIAKRIETFFDSDYDERKIQKLNQTDISNNVLSKIITPSFQGLGHWSNRPIHNVLLSLTRKRPRDLVKLLHGAARKAYLHNNPIITSGNLESTFESYSSERLQDIINEFRSELPNIEELVFGMRPTKKERRTAESYLYTTDQLIVKMKDIIGHSTLHYTNGRRVTPKSLIQFLYKIDFITARRDTSDGIDRKYFDQNKFLANEVVDFGYNWEVHPAYRWALQPQSVAHILDSIRP